MTRPWKEGYADSDERDDSETSSSRYATEGKEDYLEIKDKSGYIALIVLLFIILIAITLVWF